MCGSFVAARGQATGAATNGPATVVSPEAARPLRPGEVVEHNIGGGEVQVFSVPLEAGQFARLVVERRGVELLVTVASPAGHPALRFENPAGAQSPIVAFIAAEEAGPYTVEVRPVDKWATSGRYVLRFEEARASTAQDGKRLEAARRVAEGRRLQLLETPESRGDALTEYRHALALWEGVADNFEAANTLHYMAQTYRALRRLDESTLTYGQVLKRREGDTQATAYTLLGLAAARGDTKEPLTALPHYEKALALFRQTHNRRGEAAALYGIGYLYARQWDMSNALKYYEPALTLYRAEGDRYEEARTLNSMGGMYDLQLKPLEAMASYEQALKGWEATGDLTQKGNTLNNLGKIYDDLGDWHKAIELYFSALDCYQASEASAADVERHRASIRRKRATTLFNLGYSYITFGDWAEAEKYLLKSLREYERPSDIGATHAQLAYAYVQAGRLGPALEHCEKALPLLEADPRRAQTLTVLGMIRAAQGAHAQALEVYRQALDLQRNPKSLDLHGQARTLAKMGDAHAALGKGDEALVYFARARDLWQSIRDREGEALTLFGAARVESARGNTDAALRHIGAALELTEPLRANITDRQQRASYLATKVSYYGLYIELKMRAGGGAETAAAFEASERSRARSLLDLLSDARVEKIADGDPSLAALVERRRHLLRETRATTMRRTQAAAQKQSAEEVAAIEREASRLDFERAGVEAQIRSAHPRYADLIFPQPLSAAEVQQLLDQDTLLLEFFLGDDASYVWAVTPTEIAGHRLPPRREIEESARRLQEHLSKGRPRVGETAAARNARLAAASADYWREAAALSRTLLGPVASRLTGKRLLIVADGALMYLPFGALPAPTAAGEVAPHTPATAGHAPLLRDHVVAHLPSASVLSALRKTTRGARAAKSVAVFADPVFEGNDPRLKAARRDAPPQAPPPARRDELTEAVRDLGEEGDGTTLSRLPSTIKEAGYILSAAERASSLEATGFKANRENATDPRLGQYDVIHFATHGILNEKHPELSGLVLSLYDDRGRFREDGFLSLSDIYGLNLPVDLVVLSACRTGLGKEVRGEGLIGLTRGFMYAGAPRVVASLWQVDDEATAELMKHFYLKMFKERMSPAEALRAAQVSVSGQRRWGSPYYWAGFVLQGEWR